MRCEQCHGRGYIQHWRGSAIRGAKDVSVLNSPSGWVKNYYVSLPCPECQGSGWQHCCEGDQAQPEDEE